MTAEVKLDEKGLVPAIAQNVNTGEVLMLGYMNPGSLKRTLEGGEVWFFSRSRSDLWHKGEVSGNYMRIKSAAVDCDGDTLILQVEPDGPICHTGESNCFFTPIDEFPEFYRDETGPGVLEDLFALIQDRKREMPEGSYTTSLLQGGPDRIAQKVIEEAGETAIAGVKRRRPAGSRRDGRPPIPRSRTALSLRRPSRRRLGSPPRPRGLVLQWGSDNPFAKGSRNGVEKSQQTTVP